MKTLVGCFLFLFLTAAYAQGATGTTGAGMGTSGTSESKAEMGNSGLTGSQGTMTKSGLDAAQNTTCMNDKGVTLNKEDKGYAKCVKHMKKKLKRK